MGNDLVGGETMITSLYNALDLLTTDLPEDRCLSAVLAVTLVRGYPETG